MYLTKPCLMKRILPLIAGLILTLPAWKTNAQSTPLQLPRCGYELVWKNLEKKNPGFRRKYDELIIGQQGNAAKPTGIVYRIPVVFHVVYFQNGTTVKGNIADSVLHYQITILNDAFRKRHADTGNLRSVFKPLSADAEIEFYLATKDPGGANTTGITRTATNIDGFATMDMMMTMSMDSLERIKHTALGGHEAWPANRYLNIWVADMSINTGVGNLVFILGYATPPLNPLPPNWGTDPTELLGMKDGVVLQYQCVGGNKNPYVAEVMPMSANGRTAVHEVGHYLGLRHIWGDPMDDSSACTALATDGINDTPDQAQESHGTPSSLQNTCHEGEPGDLPDLWENYMDYSDDANTVMFSQGQVNLMRNILANQRDSLVNQSPTGFRDKDTKHNAIVVYPQPARQNLVIAFEGKIDQVIITDVLGKTVKTTTGSKTMDISGLPSGMYFLKLQSGHEFYTRQVLVAH
jgi:hypothetical protein